MRGILKIADELNDLRLGFVAILDDCLECERARWEERRDDDDLNIRVNIVSGDMSGDNGGKVAAPFMLMV